MHTGYVADVAGPPTTPTVDRCESSTITEAWATVLGLPGPIDPTDAPVLGRAARDAIPDLALKPAVVTESVPPDQAAPPYWNQQVTWQNGTHLARFGHRYLSVHFLRQGEKRYTTFAESLAPALDAWLDIYGALGPSTGDHHIDRIGFGYTNRFELDAADFDVSRHFRLNVAVDVGQPEAGLLGMHTTFQLYNAREDLHHVVSLAAESDAGDRVFVVTKVVAEIRGTNGVTFANRDHIAQQVNRVRAAAKRTFFEFATKHTHELMGATYASDHAD